MTLMDAASYDIVLVETVGVGQAEVEVASTAHTTLVVEAPGMGDEVQAIKAGILEIGDMLVVNKADRPGVDRTVKALEMMLQIENSSTRLIRHHGQVLRIDDSAPPAMDDEEERWQVTVMKTAAASKTGIEELRMRIDAHMQWLHDSGEIALREQVRMAYTLENIIRAELNRRIQERMPAGGLGDLVDRVYRREADPYGAARELLLDL